MSRRRNDASPAPERRRRRRRPLLLPPRRLPGAASLARPHAASPRRGRGGAPDVGHGLLHARRVDAALERAKAFAGSTRRRATAARCFSRSCSCPRCTRWARTGGTSPRRSGRCARTRSTLLEKRLRLRAVGPGAGRAWRRWWADATPYSARSRRWTRRGWRRRRRRDPPRGAARAAYPRRERGQKKERRRPRAAGFERARVHPPGAQCQVQETSGSVHDLRRGGARCDSRRDAVAHASGDGEGARSAVESARARGEGSVRGAGEGGEGAVRGGGPAGGDPGRAGRGGGGGEGGGGGGGGGGAKGQGGGGGEGGGEAGRQQATRGARAATGGRTFGGPGGGGPGVVV